MLLQGKDNQYNKSLGGRWNEAFEKFNRFAKKKNECLVKYSPCTVDKIHCL